MHPRSLRPAGSRSCRWVAREGSELLVFPEGTEIVEATVVPAILEARGRMAVPAGMADRGGAVGRSPSSAPTIGRCSPVSSTPAQREGEEDLAARVDPVAKGAWVGGTRR